MILHLITKLILMEKITMTRQYEPDFDRLKAEIVKAQELANATGQQVYVFSQEHADTGGLGFHHFLASACVDLRNGQVLERIVVPQTVTAWCKPPKRSD